MDRLVGVVYGTRRRHIHAQEDDFPGHQVFRRLQGEARKAVVEGRRVDVPIPPCLCKDAAACLEAVCKRLEIPPANEVVAALAGEVEHHGSADERFQRNLIKGHPSGDDMGRRVKVGAYVVAQAHRLDGIPVLFHRCLFAKLRRGISRPDHRVLPHGMGQVDHARFGRCQSSPPAKDVPTPRLGPGPPAVGTRSGWVPDNEGF